MPLSVPTRAWPTLSGFVKSLLGVRFFKGQRRQGGEWKVSPGQRSQESWVHSPSGSAVSPRACLDPNHLTHKLQGLSHRSPRFLQLLVIGHCTVSYVNQHVDSPPPALLSSWRVCIAHNNALHKDNFHVLWPLKSMPLFCFLGLHPVFLFPLPPLSLSLSLAHSLFPHGLLKASRYLPAAKIEVITRSTTAKQREMFR